MSRPHGESRPLRATLRVEPPEGLDCGVLESAADGGEVTNSITVGGSGGEPFRCHAEVTVVEDGRASRELVTTPIDDRCLCLALRRRDCVADIEGVHGREIAFSVTVADRDELREVVAALRETGATVRLQRLVDLDRRADGRTIELDRGEVTDKQREAIRTAYELGYYETPRRADLADVADELGVTRSAASQRLNAVASKLVLELIETEGDRPAGSAGRRAAGADD